MCWKYGGQFSRYDPKNCITGVTILKNFLVSSLDQPVQIWVPALVYIRFAWLQDLRGTARSILPFLHHAPCLSCYYPSHFVLGMRLLSSRSERSKLVMVLNLFRVHEFRSQPSIHIHVMRTDAAVIVFRLGRPCCFTTKAAIVCTLCYGMIHARTYIVLSTCYASCHSEENNHLVWLKWGLNATHSHQGSSCWLSQGPAWLMFLLRAYNSTRQDREPLPAFESSSSMSDSNIDDTLAQQWVL